MDLAEQLRELSSRSGAGWHPCDRERAEQAAARAAVHLERYLRDDRKVGDRRYLEDALEALREALAAAA